MKKVVLLCIMMAALCCMAYAEYQVNAPGYETAKLRYWQLVEKVVDGTATSGEEAEFSDLCQVYGFEVPVTEPVEPYDPENRDHSSLDAGADCASATVIECPFGETVAMDGDNDCSLVSAAPYSDLFYQFTPAVAGRYQFRVRHYNGGTSSASIRIVKGACCTSGTTVGRAYSSNSIATDCPRPDSVGNEPSTCVAYLNAKLHQDTTYWIQIGTSSNLAVTTNIQFNMWCIERPSIEEPQLHNTCADAFEIQCNDSLWGDSALWSTPATWDWYKIVIPDYSPDICSLRVFVGGREMGHYISGLYNMSTQAYDGYAVDGRFSMWKEREGEFCVIDSVIGGYGYDDGCSYDAVRTILTTPGTYYIKVANDNNYEYVLKTNCATYSSEMACCFIDGTCLNTTAGECVAAGGWVKPGVTCSADPCPTSACPYDNLDVEDDNDFCGEGVPTVVCDGWYCGVIPAVSDTDWYKIEVPEGVCETLRVDIYGNDTPSQWPYNQGLDPYVEIWSADCLTRLAYNYDANGVDPNPVLDDSRVQYKIALAPGWYYIKVRSEYSTVGPYVMHVSCITYECPDLTGDTCDPARVVTFTEGVYLDTRSTCDFTDNYRPTCVGSYGNGPDVIYTIELDGST
ncbi:hypothetical protein EHM69_09030, partial [candidate division KSB1 bacterium]